MPESERPTFDVAVPAKDPEQKNVDKPKQPGDKGKARDDGKDESNDMSEEDLQLKVELEMLVQRLREHDTGLYKPALESLRTIIRTSTSSMTSVPKPLKFLRPFYEEMGRIREGWNDNLQEQKSLLASILSVLAMTYSDTGRRETLYFRIISGSTEAPGLWGHEYVRHLAAELGEEYSNTYATLGEDSDIAETNSKYTTEQLKALAIELVEFFLKHNAEADAVDILLEVENISAITEHVDDKTFERVCRYMVNCVPLLVAPDDNAFLETASVIYAKFDRYPEALTLAVRLNSPELIRRYYEAPRNPVMRKQLSYFLARAQIPLHWIHRAEDETDVDETIPQQPEDVLECLGNVKLSSHFRNFGKAVGVEDPKSVDDIYKTHLEPSTRKTSIADSARQNLASTFVNAFVNAGFGNDKLIVNAPEGQSWIYRNKDHGMMSATASAGLSLLWDSENGINHIDKYSYLVEEHIKAGAFLATGIVHCGIRSETDIVFAMLEEHVDSKSVPLKVSAINGLAIAYAGSQRQDIADKLLPYVQDESTSMEVAAMAILALGFVFVGSSNGDIASEILQTLMEREEAQLASEWTVFACLGLGLLYLSAQEECEPTLATLSAIEHPVAQTATTIVDMCAHTGTGNVLKIQEMLYTCSEHAVEKKDKKEGFPVAGDGSTENPIASTDVPGTVPVLSPPAPPAPAGAPTDPEGDIPMAEAPTEAGTSNSDAQQKEVGVSDIEKKESEKEEKSSEQLKHQSFATIGIALVAMGEEVGAEMALRQFQHLMTYGDPVIRKSVPLALGLISASNPQLSILDTLSKYSHDSDLDVAINSILSMGLVGAGTNNARLAQMLRGLAVYYAREADCLFMVRIAQGLVHMGKGTIGINPYYNDRQVMSKTAVAGLLSVIVSFTNARKFVLSTSHWMLYWIVTAMYPQFLITLNEELEEIPVTVRVGQAVNTVAQAGTRHGISGFQTHQSPVRIGTMERAELGTNEFFPYQSVLEGLVILKKNEQYDAEDLH
ncbi:uncharacterized protein L203_104698 [Cryptococcus depauperatus CBS 7841]|uniref:26S proteasome regulatory subunit RPN1 n=1 Tax=Cryptococcus depauperatus CBS 7841 TaxID=1295531 RepID=A0A1E3ILR8_9TREE|nr:26S proteasome regulatory subunit N1 [Cryptococcus depauperatus CBS 7841]